MEGIRIVRCSEVGEQIRPYVSENTAGNLTPRSLEENKANHKQNEKRIPSDICHLRVSNVHGVLHARMASENIS